MRVLPIRIFVAWSPGLFHSNRKSIMTQAEIVSDINTKLNQALLLVADCGDKARFLQPNLRSQKDVDRFCGRLRDLQSVAFAINELVDGLPG